MKIAIALSMVACAGAAMAEPVRSGSGPAGAFAGPRSLLVDQTQTDFVGLVDQNFGDFASYATGMVDDISTGGQTWNLTSLTTFYTKGSGAWDTSITTAQLTFFSKSGSSPTGADQVFTTGVNVTMIDLGNAWAMRADLSGVGMVQGLNGDFWIGLTPNADFGVYGQEFHLISNVATNGANAHLRNPGGDFGFGTDWVTGAALNSRDSDMLMAIEGNVVPAPAALAVLGLGGLVAGRRRR